MLVNGTEGEDTGKFDRFFNACASNVFKNFASMRIEKNIFFWLNERIDINKKMVIFVSVFTIKRRILTIVARCSRRRRGVSLVAAAHLEDHLHVVTGASSTDAFMKVVLGRSADEIVIVAWQEL